jgi:hypothetical protein
MKLKVIFIFMFGGSRPENLCKTGGCCAASLCLLAAVLCAAPAHAQDRPFFVTYDHGLEEPGNLELELNPVFGTQRGGGEFLSSSLELEYGAKGWWSTALYLDGQLTRNDTGAFTGFRWENRFRPLMVEHRVNPVLYLELARLSEADKTILEVAGHDVEAHHAEPTAETRHEHETEVEAKLILSSQVKGWNVSENLVVEKGLEEGPWAFGYAVGAARPLALAASPGKCSFCRENIMVGVEVYGGLGDSARRGLRQTSHYVAPVVAWEMASGLKLRVSPTFGLNGNSHRFLLRFGAAYEIEGLGRRRAREGHRP